MATFCFQCVTSFFEWKKEDLELNFLDNGLIRFKFLESKFEFMKNFYVV